MIYFNSWSLHILAINCNFISLFILFIMRILVVNQSFLARISWLRENKQIIKFDSRFHINYLYISTPPLPSTLYCYHIIHSYK